MIWMRSMRGNFELFHRGDEVLEVAVGLVRRGNGDRLVIGHHGVAHAWPAAAA